MKEMILIRAKSTDGAAIRCVQEWREHAPPKKPLIQWQDFRSAKELARSWLRYGVPSMPIEYSELLHSHKLTRRFEPEIAIAEVEIRIDEFFGPRNSDLVVIGKASRQPIVLAVEAKADEEFAKIIAAEMQRLSTKSNKPERMARLVAAILDRPLDTHVNSLRYQLLHSLAATAIKAREHEAKLGVLLIHEFISLKLDFEKVTANATDLKTFVRTIPGWENETVVTGQLLPPIKLRGNQDVPGDQLVTIGKVRTLVPLDAGERERGPAGFITRNRQFLVPSPSTIPPV